jgi:hypothetical protein
MLGSALAIVAEDGVQRQFDVDHRDYVQFDGIM